MNFTISRDTWLSALNKAAAISGKSTSLPILEFVRLSAHDGTLTMQVNSLESAISLKVQADIQADGETCAPTKRLAEIVKICGDGEIAVSFDGLTSRLEIVSGGSKFKLSCLEPSDFPSVPELPVEYIPVLVPEFCVALANVSFCASSSETRFGLNSVCLEELGHGLQLTATDGHRLARVKMPERLRIPAGKKVLLPRTAALSLAKICTSETRFALDEKCLFAVTGTEVASFRLLDMEYPDAEKVIPKECGLTVEVETKALMKALERVAIFTSERSLAVNVTIGKSDLNLIVSDSDLGEGQDSVPVSYDGDWFEFSINTAYLIELLKHMKTEIVGMEFGTENVDAQPILFRPIGQTNFFGLIMPMRR